MTRDITSLQCSACGRSLRGHPKISVKGNVHCFRCAKAVVARIQFPLDTEFDKLQTVYENTKALHEQWLFGLRRLELSSNAETSLKASAAVAGGVLGFIAPGRHYLIGTLAGWFVGIVLVELVNASRTRPYLLANKRPEIAPQPNKEQFTFQDFSLIRPHSSRVLDFNYQSIIRRRDNNTCQKCGATELMAELHVHHIRPRAQGGKDCVTNLVTLCRYCHEHEEWFGHHFHDGHRQYVSEHRVEIEAATTPKNTATPTAPVASLPQTEPEEYEVEPLPMSPWGRRLALAALLLVLVVFVLVLTIALVVTLSRQPASSSKTLRPASVPAEATTYVDPNTGRRVWMHKGRFWNDRGEEAQ